jgi:hypothetical protein
MSLSAEYDQVLSNCNHVNETNVMVGVMIFSSLYKLNIFFQ